MAHPTRSFASAVMAAALGAALGVAPGLRAQTISPTYAATYSFTDIGAVPGLPSRYGGLTFVPKHPETMIIGGTANEAGGLIYSINVVRGAGGHITGFSGTVASYVDGAFNDGGVAFGPEGVLFLARWPENELGQVKVGSLVQDKVIDLAPFGVVSSPGGLGFVPGDQPNAGQLKVVSWPTGEWYDVLYASDLMGTYDVVSATLKVTMPGGPEGFVYVPPNSPLFPNFSVLVSEFNANEVAAFETDADGDPIVSTRVTFLSGLDGAEGAVADPLTGDYLFSTFGAVSRVIVVKGFALPNGAPCTEGDDCSSDFCADGVCCNAACAGGCDVCTEALGAPADGQCTALAAGTTCTADACTRDAVCEDGGACVGTAITCAAGDECNEASACDVALGCQVTVAPDGTACTDGQCAEGFCVTGLGEGEGEGQGAGPACGCDAAGSEGSALLGAAALAVLAGALLRRRRVA